MEYPTTVKRKNACRIRAITVTPGAPEDAPYAIKMRKYLAIATYILLLDVDFNFQPKYGLGYIPIETNGASTRKYLGRLSGYRSIKSTIEDPLV